MWISPLYFPIYLFQKKKFPKKKSKTLESQTQRLVEMDPVGADFGLTPNATDLFVGSSSGTNDGLHNAPLNKAS